MCRSEWHTPERVTRTRTSLPCGFGVSKLTFCNGLPCSMTCQLSIRSSLIGRDRALARPGAQRSDLFRHHHRQRLRSLHLGFNDLRLQLVLCRARFVERADDRLLDLRAREAVAGAGQTRHVEGRRVLLLARELDAQDLLAAGGARQVDEEYLVEAPFAQQLGRQ